MNYERFGEKIEIEEGLKRNVELINEVLNQLNKPNLLENPDFTMGDMSTEYYLHLILETGGSNVIPLDFRIDDEVIQVDLDRESEVFVWPRSFIEKSRSEVIEQLCSILTGHITVEYCGENYTRFEGRDKNGRVLFNFPVISGLYWKLNCKSKQFSPIYS